MRTNSGGTISDADFLQTEIKMGVGFDSPAYIALIQGVYNLLKKSINPASSFEIGAGTGVLLSIMAGEIAAVGIDPMQIHVDYCTGHAPHTVNCYHRMKIQDYRFTQKFDVAISIEVFEHIPGDDVPEVKTIYQDAVTNSIEQYRDALKEEHNAVKVFMAYEEIKSIKTN